MSSSVAADAAPTAWRHRLAAELAPRRLMGSLAAALILYLLVCIMTLSIAAMVYAGPLVALLPQALGGILVGVALLVAVISLFAAWGGTVGTTQDGSGVILALGAAAAAAAMPAAAPEVLAATVSTLLLLATLAFGGLCLLLGSFGLGTLVRYLPMPVIGGFLAGTGWLLVAGGIGVAAQASFGWSLLEPGAAVRWLPALVLGVAMLVAVQVGRHAALLVPSALSPPCCSTPSWASASTVRRNSWPRPAGCSARSRNNCNGTSRWPPARWPPWTGVFSRRRCRSRRPPSSSGRWR